MIQFDGSTHSDAAVVQEYRREVTATNDYKKKYTWLYSSIIFLPEYVYYIHENIEHKFDEWYH
jgi:hypothetical protein